MMSRMVAVQEVVLSNGDEYFSRRPGTGAVRIVEIRTLLFAGFPRSLETSGEKRNRVERALRVAFLFSRFLFSRFRDGFLDFHIVLVFLLFLSLLFLGEDGGFRFQRSGREWAARSSYPEGLVADWRPAERETSWYQTGSTARRQYLERGSPVEVRTASTVHPRSTHESGITGDLFRVC